MVRHRPLIASLLLLIVCPVISGVSKITSDNVTSIVHDVNPLAVQLMLEANELEMKGFTVLLDSVYMPERYFGHNHVSHEELHPLYRLLADGQILCNCTSLQCGISAFPHSALYDGLCITTGGCRKMAVMKPANRKGDNRRKIVIEMGCVNDDMWFFDGHPIACTKKHKLFTDVVDAYCCENEHFCAGERLMRYVPHPKEMRDSGQVTAMSIGAICVVIVILTVLVLAAIRLISGANPLKEMYSMFRRVIGKPVSDKEEFAPQFNEMHDIEHIFDAVYSGGMTSGSGAGDPLMMPRTFARQITLQREKAIGAGKFGEVWLGMWKEEPCAVKIFHSFEEKSWFREVDIYQTNMLRHANILGFIASDNVDTGTTTQLWLVTEYHENGSLYDYLTDHALTKHGMLRMVRSIANGLSFLHTGIDGTHCKPAIAHRDMKSKNILVKKDLSCCIGDLGMAVRYQNGCVDMPTGARVGTRRYLAPEILDGSLNPRQFDSFRRADIYAFGLVIWEIARCTQTDDGKCYLFEQPYFDMVEPDPSEDSMMRVVVTEGRRPLALPEWKGDDIMCELYNAMTECWAANPTSRLTSLRVRKTADKLADRLGSPAIYEAQLNAEKERLSVRRTTLNQHV